MNTNTNTHLIEAINHVRNEIRIIGNQLAKMKHPDSTYFLQIQVKLQETEDSLKK